MELRAPIAVGLAVFSLGVLACSPQDNHLHHLGSATAQLELAPTLVGCVVVQVVGVVTVTQQFDVAPQGNSGFALSGLPLGLDAFTAKAYSVACSQSAAATATYVSNSVAATVTADAPVTVTLNMVGGAAGDATVRVEFPAGPLAPVGVGCIIVQAVGATTVSNPFDVAPEGDTVFALIGLPLGSDSFTAQAFSVPCAQTATASAAWSSAAVTADITPNAPGNVSLLMVEAAPSNLTYSTNPAVYPVGTAIAPNVPSSSGGPVVSYSVSPALPVGLSLDPTTGVISGTPTTAGTASCVVKASNSAGNTTVTLNITVKLGGSGEETVRVEFPPTITEFPLAANALPLGIAAGPDGNLWFAESGATANRIGRITTAGAITEFAIPTAASVPTWLAAGPDGNLWFTEQAGQKIGRITTSGAITEFAIPDISYLGNASGLNPFGITAGPDGNLWFTGTRVNSPFADVGRITTSGAITQFQLGFVRPEGIAAGPDGNLWFTEYGANKIGTITTSGTVTEYAGGPNAPTSIAAGPDGNLWFGEFNDIGVITTGGTVTELYPDCSACQADGIVAAPDGNLWFTDFGADDIGSITTSGAITKFPIPNPSTTGLGPYGIAVGSDGNLWFTEYDANKVGRITLPPVVAPAGVACIIVQVTPNLANPTYYSFDVGPGASTVFTLSDLPLGSAFFTAQAFAVPCAQTGGASATYASSGVTATVTAGAPASVSLLLVAQ